MPKLRMGGEKLPEIIQLPRGDSILEPKSSDYKPCSLTNKIPVLQNLIHLFKCPPVKFLTEQHIKILLKRTGCFTSPWSIEHSKVQVSNSLAALGQIHTVGFLASQIHLEHRVFLAVAAAVPAPTYLAFCAPRAPCQRWDCCLKNVIHARAVALAPA